MNYNNKTFLICHDNKVEVYTDYTAFTEDYVKILKDYLAHSHRFIAPQAYVSDGNHLILYPVSNK